MKAWIVAGISVVLVAGICTPMFFGPSDSQLIKDALNESVKASRDGKPGGVLDYLSQSLKINDENMANRSEIANYIKHARPDVEIEDETAVITGDSATVVSPVSVTFSLGPVSQPIRLSHVEITLAKEFGTRFLIFPAPKWRIKDIKASESDLAQFQQ